MANPTAPSTSLTIKGVEYKLAFDFQSIADAEELTGRSLITGLDRKAFDSPSIKLVQAMLYACLKKNHPEMSYPLAKTFVTLKSIGKVWDAVVSAWVEAMNEPEEGEVVGEAKGQS